VFLALILVSLPVVVIAEGLSTALYRAAIGLYATMASLMPFLGVLSSETTSTTRRATEESSLPLPSAVSGIDHSGSSNLSINVGGRR